MKTNKLKEYEKTANDVRISYVKKIVCAFYGVPLKSMNTTRRIRNRVQVKQVCIYVIKSMLAKDHKMSLNYIGTHFYGEKGLGMDHATVLYSARTIAGHMEYDTELRGEVAEIESLVKNRMNVFKDSEFLGSNYYFIDYDNVTTVRVENHNGKSISFTGFTEDEIAKIVAPLNCDTPKNHENTGLFILTKKED